MNKTQSLLSRSLQSNPNGEYRELNKQLPQSLLNSMLRISRRAWSLVLARAKKGFQGELAEPGIVSRTRPGFISCYHMSLLISLWDSEYFLRPGLVSYLVLSPTKYLVCYKYFGIIGKNRIK